ncbi:MAG: serine hydrolase [Patescibacteria group bacterium]
MLPSLLISAFIITQVVPPAFLIKPLTLDFANADQPTIAIAEEYPSHIYPGKKPQKISPSLGIDTTGASAVVFDPIGGQQLFRKNPNTVRSIASLTKLMTVLVFLDHNPGFGQEVEITEADQIAEGSIGLEVGDKVIVRDLFYASLVNSANNATQALARSTGMSREVFVAAMNQRAKDMGLSNTHFVDVTGLDPGNVSTASEVARMADFAFRNAEISQATTLPNHEFTTLNTNRTIRFNNTNKLLESFLHLSGGKTGYTEEAGYCLAIRTDDGQGHDIVVVDLGTAGPDERFQEVKGLISWTFENWRWPAD